METTHLSRQGTYGRDKVSRRSTSASGKVYRGPWAPTRFGRSVALTCLEIGTARFRARLRSLNHDTDHQLLVRPRHPSSRPSRSSSRWQSLATVFSTCLTLSTSRLPLLDVTLQTIAARPTRRTTSRLVTLPSSSTARSPHTSRSYSQRWYPRVSSSMLGTPLPQDGSGMQGSTTGATRMGSSRRVMLRAVAYSRPPGFHWPSSTWSTLRGRRRAADHSRPPFSPSQLRLPHALAPFRRCWSLRLRARHLRKLSTR